MSDQWAPAPPPKKPRRWSRRLAWIAGVSIIFLVFVYFFATSHAFLEMFVLPKVNSALGTPVTLGDSGISPFRKVSLENLKVGGSAFEEPLVTAREIRARYSLFDIIGGNINIHEVALVSPVVQILVREDGTSNLDPFLKPSGEPAQPDPPPGDSKPVQFHLGRFVLTNATIRYTKMLPNGGREVAELTGVNISAANLGNAKSGSLSLATALRFQRAPGPGAADAPELIEATFGGNFEIALTPDLKPDIIRGSTRLDLVTPPAAAKELKGMAAVLECDLLPTEVRQLSLTFRRANTTLGQISASGPFDLARKEGTINLEIASIGREALNLAGATAGLDFGSTTINSTHQVTITNAGQMVLASGRLAATKLSVVQQGTATRPLDVRFDYAVSLDQENKSALIERFTISGDQDSTPVLRGALAGPMRLDLGGGANLAQPSEFNLQVTNFSLADWKAFLGEIGGVATVDLNVAAANAGRRLAVRLDSKLANLSAVVGSNNVERAGVSFGLRAALENFNNFRLEECALLVRRDAALVLSLLASARGDLTNKITDAQLNVNTHLGALGALASIPDLPPISVKLDAQLQQRGQEFAIPKLTADLAQDARAVGAIALEAAYDLATTNGSAVLKVQLPNLLAFAATNPAPAKPVSFDATFSAAIAGNVATIREFAGRLAQNGRAGGSFDVKGKFHLQEQVGDIDLQLADLNEAALAPFLNAALGEGRTLKSGSITLSATAHYDPKGASSWKSDLQLARFVIDDPAKKLPVVPLNTTVKLAASLRNDELKLDEFSTDLAMADAAGGQIRASGSCHLKNKTAQGTIKVSDLNQKFLGPFVAAALGDKSLSSVSINIDLAGRYDPARDAALNGDISVNNLLLTDPEGKLPKTPLAGALNVGVALASNRIATIDLFRFKLAPTARAKNELNVAGKIDLSRSNIFSGDLQVLAESLDLTPYYDMFATAPVTNALAETRPPAQPAPKTTPATNAPPAEPPPVNLPFDRFNLAINIGQLYLREIAIHNWLTGIKLGSNQVQIAPLQLLANGAPIKSEVALNLGVPGYEYDIFLNADRIPAAPFVDTFSPEQRGKVEGELLLAAQVKGAGVTGRSLQKTLAGNASFSFTNANLKLTAPWIRTVFYPIGFAVGAPDLVNSPVSWLAADAKLGGGKIQLKQFNLVSETFTADTQGDIRIADVLADSPLDQWPMHVWLRRSLAQKIRMVPRSTPREAQYVKMPDFVKLAGTVAEPKTEINKLALSGAAIDKALDAVIQDKTGGINPLNLLKK